MLAIVDYKCGNVGSILNMLRRIGTSDVVITSDPTIIEKADKLILPGVGSFDTGMFNIKQMGLLDVLNEQVLRKSIPVLGICMGMQLFMQSSEEGLLPGLGWLVGTTVRFRVPTDTPIKIPHMGWNTVRLVQDIPLFNDFSGDYGFYFVHSYHVMCQDRADVAALTAHGYEFASIVARGNIMGTQFHPEKSHKHGMLLLKNFVEGY